MKINLNALIFPVGHFFLHHFIVFQYFYVIFGGFLTFWKNFQIQDGGSKITNVVDFCDDVIVLSRDPCPWSIGFS